MMCELPGLIYNWTLAVLIVVWTACMTVLAVYAWRSLLREPRYGRD